jgi:tol-pal system protein YbgF
MMKVLLAASMSFLLFMPAFSFAQSERGSLQHLVEEIQAMKATADLNNKRIAAALAEFERFQEEMVALRGQIEAIQHVVDEGSAKNTEQSREMTYRLARMEERVAEMRTMLEEFAALDKKKQTEAYRLLYEQALSELTQGHFQSSIKLFDQFIKKYRKNSFIDNAYYWQGEAHYALGDYEKAILSYQSVVEKYKQSDKRAAAMLKQAYSFAALKSYADAKAFLEVIVTTYPNSEEAIAAREKLVDINALMAVPADPHDQSKTTD